MKDTESKEVELKPCPFCGIYPKTFKLDDLTEMASCCGCVIKLSTWNKRPQENNLVPLDEEEVANALVDAHGILNKHLLKKEYYLPYAKTICAKFGKDNNGIVSQDPLWEYCIHQDDCVAGQCRAGRPTKDGGYESLYGYGSNEKWYPREEYPECTCGLDRLMKERQFSPQPPKERKVSLEEIEAVISRCHAKNMNLGFGARKNEIQMDGIVAQAILSLLNATEGR
jgi:hypothetical protein